MPTTILPLYSGVGAPLTITLASLASSTAGVGRQSTMIDNATTRYKRIYLSASIKLGTSPNSNALIALYLLRYDGTSIRTDGAGTTDAGLTVKNAQQFATLVTGPSASTGDVLTDTFTIDDPGRNWGIAIVNITGVALDATGSNHVINWYAEVPQIQN